MKIYRVIWINLDFPRPDPNFPYLKITIPIPATIKNTSSNSSHSSKCLLDPCMLASDLAKFGEGDDEERAMERQQTHARSGKNHSSSRLIARIWWGAKVARWKCPNVNALGRVNLASVLNQLSNKVWDYFILATTKISSFNTIQTSKF